MGGSGKTLLIQKLARALRQSGKKVILGATTGAAAVRLSRYGVTAHHLFHIPVRGQRLMPISPTHPSRLTLEANDVIMIDEMSMMTSMNLNFIIYRLMQVNTETHGSAAENPFGNKHLIIVGDLAQVRKTIVYITHYTQRISSLYVVLYA